MSFVTRHPDALVEFEVRRLLPGDLLARLWFEVGELLVLDDSGLSRSDTWLKSDVEDIDIRPGGLDIRVTRPLWAFSACPIGDCSDCPCSSALETEIELLGLDRAMEPIHGALLVQAIRRSAELGELGSPSGEFRMLAMFDHEVTWDGEDLMSRPVVAGFYTLAELAAAMGGTKA